MRSFVKAGWTCAEIHRGCGRGWERSSLYRERLPFTLRGEIEKGEGSEPVDHSWGEERGSGKGLLILWWPLPNSPALSQRLSPWRQQSASAPAQGDTPKKIKDLNQTNQLLSVSPLLTAWQKLKKGLGKCTWKQITGYPIIALKTNRPKNVYAHLGDWEGERKMFVALNVVFSIHTRPWIKSQLFSIVLL